MAWHEYFRFGRVLYIKKQNILIIISKTVSERQRSKTATVMQQKMKTKRLWKILHKVI